MWGGWLIADILQEACLGDQITDAVVVAPGEAILFFGRYLLREGLSYRNAQDVKLGLTGPVNWAGRMAQVKVTTNTVQEGCQAIANTILEKRSRASGPGHPPGIVENHMTLCHSLQC